MTGGEGARPARGSPLEVFAVFLRLGVTSFGGPVAHLGYFRAEFVERRRWLDDQAFAELVALCQFLPGPASSQVGFAIGLMRAGALGGLAAWLAFTLPSAALMTACALGLGGQAGAWETGAIHGLKLAAVAVIAQAVWGMAGTLAADRPRAVIALAALIAVTLLGAGRGQLAALLVGAGAGLMILRAAAPAADAGVAPMHLPVSPGVGLACLAAFAILLIAPPLVAPFLRLHGLAVASAFYQSGALVFGGGHVVLPLLQAKVVQPGWVDPARFLSGYALAQALPGPLFSFAAYLGALVRPGPGGLGGAALALVAIFLPGLLLLVGVAPFWNRLRRSRSAQGAIRGANAAVVGILAAALYNPVWVSAIATPLDFAIAAAGFVALTVLRAPPLAVVAVCASLGVLASIAPV